MLVRIFLFLSSCLALSAANAQSGFVTAFLGDSIATGAVAHASLKLDDRALTEVFEGRVLVAPDAATLEQRIARGYTFAGSDAPRRLAPSLREFAGPGSWAFHNALMQFSRRFLDMEEHAWSYLVGRELGSAASDVLIAAEDGARSLAGAAQARRVLEATQGALPRHVFALFTGNDLCGADLGQATAAADYGAGLTQTLRTLARHGVAGSQGTDIWLVNPISVLQLVRSPAILAKQVSAHGSVTTCGALYGLPSSAMERLASAFPFVPQTPTDYCPTLFRDARLNVTAQTVLANRIAEYRRQITNVVSSSPLAIPNGIRVHQIAATDEWLLGPDDIANDCFHLSYEGQMRLGQIILGSMNARVAIK